MAVQTKKKKPAKKKRSLRLTETQRWVCGIMLISFAAFLLVAVIGYYFCWSYDQSFVRWGHTASSGTVVMNPTGKSGAVMADYIVGRWFGVFGIAIPIILGILALRIINYKPLRMHRAVRLSIIIMLLGSLTLGYLFDTRWGTFGSGWGGMQGIIMARWLREMTGVAGGGLILLVGWILLAVYINRNSIKLFNRVGQGIYDGGRRVGDAVIGHAADLVSNIGSENDQTEDEQQAEVQDDDVPHTAALDQDHGGEERVEVDTNLMDNNPAENLSQDQAAEVEIVAAPQDVFTVVDSREGEHQLENGGETVFVLGRDGENQNNNSVRPASRGVDFPDPVIEIIGPAVEPVATAPLPHASTSGGATSGLEVIGEQHPSEDSRIEERQQDPGLRVIGGDPERTVSIGGVVETVAPGGVGTDDKLEVVVAEHKDVEVDDRDINAAAYDPTLELSRYQKPPVELLEDHTIDVRVTEEEIYENKNNIVSTLKNFGIAIDKIKATIGPTVTLYEIVPAAGVKISKIKNLEDDIALSLKALGIRIIAPMPGKGTVGIEVPNKDKEIVSMYSVIKTMKFQESDYELPIVLGKTISNETFMIDLAKMPHLLVAGATGQGKSVGLNAIITSLLYKKHPAELKFVLVDPKRVELSLYARLERHFLAKMSSQDEAILTDTQKVVYTLNSLCQEMAERYGLLQMAEVRKLSEYNEKFTKRRLNPQKGHRFLPYIVVVIDEFADMIMTAGREVEAPITRLAQLARAVGIHLVIATQRPDVKVITGLIKANFPARIAFRVMSMVDSRTIIDQPGANQLIGRGDMLMSLNGELTRVQCAFIDTPEIERITEFISNQRGYQGAYELPDYSPETDGGVDSHSDMGPTDAMFEEVARFVVGNQQGSTSSIQRRFAIGYNRAGRIMDQLEDAGIVGKADGSRPREVLITDVNSLEYLLNNMNK